MTVRKLMQTLEMLLAITITVLIFGGMYYAFDKKASGEWSGFRVCAEGDCQMSTLDRIIFLEKKLKRAKTLTSKMQIQEENRITKNNKCK